MSFEPTRDEIASQAHDLPDYGEYLASLRLSPVEPEKCIFVGAGDSLAVAVFAERLVKFLPRAFDPYDLIRNPEVAASKSVFVLSVSGKTRANIEAARAVVGFADKVVAITAYPESELAKTCSSALQLQFTKSPGLTPGTNSFTASILAVCAVLGKLPKKLDVARMIDKAKDAIPKNFSGSVHFVGSGRYYPLAMYGCAKIFECLGEPADYQFVEEFSHMNLFAVNENDTVVILRDGTSDRRALDLHENLKSAGLNTLLLDFDEQLDEIEQGIFYAIQLQYLALRLAQSKGLHQPAFLERKSLLELSNKMIY